MSNQGHAGHCLIVVNHDHVCRMSLFQALLQAACESGLETLHLSTSHLNSKTVLQVASSCVRPKGWQSISVQWPCFGVCLCPIPSCHLRHWLVEFVQTKVRRQHTAGQHESTVSTRQLHCSLLTQLQKYETHKQSNITATDLRATVLSRCLHFPMA